MSTFVPSSSLSLQRNVPGHRAVRWSGQRAASTLLSAAEWLLSPPDLKRSQFYLVLELGKVLNFVCVLVCVLNLSMLFLLCARTNKNFCLVPGKSA